MGCEETTEKVQMGKFRWTAVVTLQSPTQSPCLRLSEMPGTILLGKPPGAEGHQKGAYYLDMELVASL